MLATIISRNKIDTIALPQKISGQYWFYEDGERLISIEGLNGEWVLCASRLLRIMGDDGEEEKMQSLVPGAMYQLMRGKEDMILMTEPITPDRQTFQKYTVKSGSVLRIGRNTGNDICFSLDTVSDHHANLAFRDGRWAVRDCGSRNGIFVNDIRVEEKYLLPGDVIFIMGLKIVIGSDFIALNNPDKRLILSDRLERRPGQWFRMEEETENRELKTPTYFYRSPRFKRDVEPAVFKIDSPPTSPVGEELPWVLVMGSSMTMGIMSATTLISAALSGNITSMIMGGSMLAGTVLFPMLTRSYEKKHRKQKELVRQEKYRSYLNTIRKELLRVGQLQEEILNENGVPISECEKRIMNLKRNLWERSAGQNDFLLLRLGNGTGRLNVRLQYPERQFSLTEDPLVEEQYELCEAEHLLHNIPVTYSLLENPVSGVIGDRKQTMKFAKGLMIQLAALYSYDEVKLVFFYDKEDEKELEFVRWLPHVWNDEHSFRFLASTLGEAGEISSYFEKVIENRERLNEQERQSAKPYYIVFALSKKLSLRTEMVRKILASKVNLQISLLTFYDELRNLPKECSKIVELNTVGSKLFDRDDISQKLTQFTPDITLTEDPMKLSLRLANTRLDQLDSHYKMPEMLTFLEMFGVGKVEHLNALERWKENDPTKTLRAAVGVDSYGAPFMLDLHEKHHGPHGLVAGMTGSGKSEFIITYILSLALNYHPDEVAVVLIDYKGGGTAKAFEKLPHTAGIITNLDGAAIKRSLISIVSELKRRQRLLAAASESCRISNIDIYKYQKLYREGRVKEPLQHLFIIADEFAELKTQQQEFMEQLISAARIGRSLGVHLILATQKPHGVVDDQIWSNSKFRVCLKVQEVEDSREMLKRSDAAELKETGRFYLQVGYNELFELGQSAWSGAAYEPNDHLPEKRDESIVVIDNNGHPVKQVRLNRRRSAEGTSAQKQLDAVVEYLREVAESEQIHARPLWLDPIPAVILLDELCAKYGAKPRRWELEPVIGEYDDPARQKQGLLRLPISREGNVVLYGAAGSGKTMFLDAMLYGLIREHTPEEVKLYLLDFSSETLQAFSEAPHVAEVLMRGDVLRVKDLFRRLNRELEKRRKLFADFDGSYNSYIENSRKTLPSIVVVIHNYGVFWNLCEDVIWDLEQLSREGRKYGLYFVITEVNANGIRNNILQNFKQRIVLQLNDDSEYASVVGRTEGMIPASCQGRGLIRRGELYEFQTAVLTQEENLYFFIRQFCLEQKERPLNCCAEQSRISVCPGTEELLAAYRERKSELDLPIGVDRDSGELCFYPFGKSDVTMLLSEDWSCHRYLNWLADFLVKAGKSVVSVLDLGGNLAPVQGLRVCTTQEACEAEIARIGRCMRVRDQGGSAEEDRELLVLINSVAKLENRLSEDYREKLGTILEFVSEPIKVHFIIAERVQIAVYQKDRGWYEASVRPGEGIWIGDGFAKQDVLEPGERNDDMKEVLTPEYGYALMEGRCIRLNVPGADTEEQADE